MKATDEDALICDLAEVYGVYEPERYRTSYIAKLAAGLRDNSRIKLAMVGAPCSIDTLLLACMADRLGLLVWFQTKDGAKGRNRPESITAELTNTKKKTDTAAFTSADQFEAARARIFNSTGE